MRIAVGSFKQETNDFSPVPTTRTTFEDFSVQIGKDVVENVDNLTAPELKAFIDEVGKWAVPSSILPLAEIGAMAQGRATAETMAWATETLLTPLKEEKVDGVLLSLHGACVAEGDDDPEGAIIEAARLIVGDAVPIIVTLDLHAHVTERMVRVADAVVLYHRYPHIDMYSTGQRASNVLHGILFDGCKPTSAFCKIPLHLPVERCSTQATDEEVAAGKYAAFFPYVCKRFIALEAEPWCMSAGVSTTQPWLNVTDLGNTFVIVADGAVEGAAAKAEAVAATLAREFWDARESFMPVGKSLLPAKEAVQTAHDHATAALAPATACNGVVAIGDGADATTSGAPGDSTWVLQELLAHAWDPKRPALIPMVSPEGAAAAVAAGVGGVVEQALGGVRDSRFSEAYTVTGEVEKLFDGTFDIVKGHCAGMHNTMGQCATLKLLDGAGGADTGTRLILTTGIGCHFAAELFKLGGYDPCTSASVVVCKSPAGFRSTYGPYAGMMLSSDSRGCATPRFYAEEYRSEFSKTTSPLYPLDINAPFASVNKTFPAPSNAGGGNGD